MGDPKFPVKKYDRPAHPWEGERIKRESNLVFKYGLKNKKELWRVQSFLRELRRQSRLLQAKNRTGDPQAARETAALIAKCRRLGLIKENADLNDVLLINIEDVLSRRFQTITFKKGLARSIGHARQLIVHGHVTLGSRQLTVPGYIVREGEDAAIIYTAKSPLSSDMHPMRPEPGFTGVLKEKRPDADETGRPGSRYSSRRPSSRPAVPRAVAKVVEKVVKKEVKKAVPEIDSAIETSGVVASAGEDALPDADNGEGNKTEKEE